MRGSPGASLLPPLVLFLVDRGHASNRPAASIGHELGARHMQAGAGGVSIGSPAAALDTQAGLTQRRGVRRQGRPSAL